jgi:hypothetical protein
MSPLNGIGHPMDADAMIKEKEKTLKRRKSAGQ